MFFVSKGNIFYVYSETFLASLFVFLSFGASVGFRKVNLFADVCYRALFNMEESITKLGQVGIVEFN